MKFVGFRRKWMLAGFAAAFLIGDMFLAVRGAAVSSVEFLYGVAGFSLTQVFWTVGQLREARRSDRLCQGAADLRRRVGRRRFSVREETPDEVRVRYLEHRVRAVAGDFYLGH